MRNHSLARQVFIDTAAGAAGWMGVDDVYRAALRQEMGAQCNRHKSIPIDGVSGETLLKLLFEFTGLVPQQKQCMAIF